MKFLNIINQNNITNVSNPFLPKSNIVYPLTKEFLYHNDIIYYTFNSLNKNNMFFNKRWYALNHINQKFYNMFLTNSIQQRIYSN